MILDASQTGPAIDRLCQLADLGAEPAARALGRLLDVDVEPGAARILASGDSAGFHGQFTTVGFVAHGDFDGVVAIALEERVFARALAQMVGPARSHRGMAESALQEFGNILASQTVSAIADALDAKILLSVPEFVMGETGDELECRIHGRGAPLHVETQLVGADGALMALLVIAPDPVAPGRL